MEDEKNSSKSSSVEKNKPLRRHVKEEKRCMICGEEDCNDCGGSCC